VVAVVGEPGVGKSRLFWELIHSHRVQGWLVVQSASVSYGKATAYLPVIELLRGYFEIESRDDPRKIREKITGKVMTLAPALAPTVPASWRSWTCPWMTRHGRPSIRSSGVRGRSTPSSICCCARARCSRW
jgi:hypothetical protein